MESIENGKKRGRQFSTNYIAELVFASQMFEGTCSTTFYRKNVSRYKTSRIGRIIVASRREKGYNDVNLWKLAKRIRAVISV